MISATKPCTNGWLISQSSLFTTAKPAAFSYPYLPIPSKPIKLNLHLACSYTLSCRRRRTNQRFRSVALAQGDDDTVVLEEEEEKQEAQQEFSWENQEEQSQFQEEEDEEEGVAEAVGDAGESDGDVENTSIDDDEEEIEYEEPPEEAKLFVGNLPYDVDSERLAQIFEPAGIVEIAEVIYNRTTDQSRGFGFVTMSTVEEANKALEMFHRYDVNGRHLVVNKAAPRGLRPENSPRIFEPRYKVYVGNIPWSVDDARLEQIFSEHGKVLDAKVIYNAAGQSRGFGFITMSSEAEMNDAIANLDGKNVDGRALRVNAAAEKPRRDSFQF